MFTVYETKRDHKLQCSCAVFNTVKESNKLQLCSTYNLFQLNFTSANFEKITFFSSQCNLQLCKRS